jgi:hypothetical protein
VSHDIKSILNEIKNSTYFIVEVELDDPIEFSGKIPFDMTITDNLAKFTVLANSYEDAELKVFKYLWK